MISAHKESLEAIYSFVTWLTVGFEVQTRATGASSPRLAASHVTAWAESQATAAEVNTL